MKKFVILTLIFVCALCLSISPKTTYAKNGETGTAEYISIDKAPQIDGEFDEIWNDTIAFVTDMEESEATALISVLWNESGLYFFARVFDSTTNASDRCNFWVSETFISDHTLSLDYHKVDGAYYLCLTPEGENKAYISNQDEADKYVNMAGKYTVATSTTAIGYNVEVYVPLFGKSSLIEWNSIGFNVSIDDYLTVDAERESYSYWSAFGKYWSDPSKLAEVTLVDYYMDETVNQTPNDSANSSDDNTSSITSSEIQTSTSENSEVLNDENKGKKGCGSTISTSLLASLLFFGVFFKKRK